MRPFEDYLRKSSKNGKGDVFGNKFKLLQDSVEILRARLEQGEIEMHRDGAVC